MIDTIKLILNVQDIQITKPELFRPSAKTILNSNSNCKKCKKSTVFYQNSQFLINRKYHPFNFHVKPWWFTIKNLRVSKLKQAIANGNH